MSDERDDLHVWNRRLLRTLTFLPPLAILGLIARYVVNAPFHDEWDWSVRHVVQGDLLSGNLSEFWRLNNEHRVFLPKLLGAALGHLTGLDMRALVIAKFVLTLGTLGLLIQLYRARVGRPRIPYAPLLLSAWVFSFSQWPRWVDVRPIPSTLSILGLAGMLLALCGAPPSRRRFAAALVCAWVSSSSYFSGNVTWFIGALTLVSLRWNPRFVSVWLLASGLVAWNYWSDFSNRDTLTSIGGERDPVEFLQFVLIFLGSCCTTAHRGLPIQIEALIYGVVGISATCALGWANWKRSKAAWNRTVPWLAIQVWVLVNAIATAYGRLPNAGLPSARAWRYTVFSALFWAAFGILAATELFEQDDEDSPHSRPVALGGVIVLFLALVGGNLGMLDSGGIDGYPKNQRAARATFLLEPTADPFLLETQIAEPDWYFEHLPELMAMRASFLYGERQWGMDTSNRHNAVSMRHMSVGRTPQKVFQINRKASIGWRETILDRPYAYASFRLASRKPGKEVHVSVLVRVDNRGKSILECRTAKSIDFNEEFRVDLTPWIGQEIAVRFRCQADSETEALLLTPKIIYDVRQRDPQ